MTKDPVKVKGINLNAQTMLKVADTDAIMNILASLDVQSAGIELPHSDAHFYPVPTAGSAAAAVGAGAMGAAMGVVGLSSASSSSFCSAGSSGPSSPIPAPSNGGNGGSGGMRAPSSSAALALQRQHSIEAQLLKEQIHRRNRGRLFNFVQAADPTQSFLDLSLALDEPVEEVITTTVFIMHDSELFFYFFIFVFCNEFVCVCVCVFCSVRLLI
jgi:hypothetical protein